MNGTLVKKLVVATDKVLPTDCGWFDMFHPNEIARAKSALEACKRLNPSARLEYWVSDRIKQGNMGDWSHGPSEKSPYRD